MRETFDIGEAKTKMKKEMQKVARKGWNGKNMYLFYVPEDNWQLTNWDNKFPMLPFVAMKTADDKIVPWLASQTDLLADDYFVVE